MPRRTLTPLDVKLATRELTGRLLALTNLSSTLFSEFHAAETVLATASPGSVEAHQAEGRKEAILTLIEWAVAETEAIRRRQMALLQSEPVEGLRHQKADNENPAD